MSLKPAYIKGRELDSCLNWNKSVLVYSIEKEEKKKRKNPWSSLTYRSYYSKVTFFKKKDRYQFIDFNIFDVIQSIAAIIFF